MHHRDRIRRADKHLVSDTYPGLDLCSSDYHRPLYGGACPNGSLVANCDRTAERDSVRNNNILPDDDRGHSHGVHLEVRPLFDPDTWAHFAARWADTERPHRPNRCLVDKVSCEPEIDDRHGADATG